MPQASEELRARWDGPSDELAMAYLTARGFNCDNDYYVFVAPFPEEEMLEADWSAIDFMVNEWDYGGVTFPEGNHGS